MLIHRAYKTELDPNSVQRSALLNHAGAARYVWNWALDRRIKEYGATGKSLSAMDQHKELVILKKTELPWLYEVSKWAPQEALRNLDQAFGNFFAGRASYPKFKSKKKNGIGGFKLLGLIVVEATRIRLPKLGWLRLKEVNYLPTSGVKINSAVISEKAGRWFVSLQVEEEIAVPKNQGPAIGIDLGLKTFAVGSDGREWVAPKPLKASLKKLQRLSRRHSRKKAGSANRKKSARLLARLHYQIGCQRKDYLDKVASQLARTYSEIVIETLNVAGMVQNRSLSRSISDVSWSAFVRTLEYKAAWHGSLVIKADRFYPSTKTCSCCGAVKDMPLRERVYSCASCGLSIGRDLNAARNLLSLSSAGSARIDACGDLRRSLKQEPSFAHAN
jgi:putative transposase